VQSTGIDKLVSLLLQTLKNICRRFSLLRYVPGVVFSRFNQPTLPFVEARLARAGGVAFHIVVD
jgi:O-acetylhomoserine/O-acetylserine sulfhydrylase-like pyridoxal-dependent enzyme